MQAKTREFWANAKAKCGPERNVIGHAVKFGFKIQYGSNEGLPFIAAMLAAEKEGLCHDAFRTAHNRGFGTEDLRLEDWQDIVAFLRAGKEKRRGKPSVVLDSDIDVTEGAKSREHLTGQWNWGTEDNVPVAEGIS